MKKFLCIAAMLSFVIAKADIVTPGQVNKGFMITNINKFKQYKFTFIYQNYRYDHGYQHNGETVSTIEANQTYYCSSHGDKSFITATDSSGKTFVSKIEIGGQAKFAAKVKGYTEVYEIVSVKNGVVILKKTKEILTTKKGVKETKLSLFSNNGSYGLLWLFVCSGIALGVVALLFKRRKPTIR